jgi:hypothetical protein
MRLLPGLRRGDDPCRQPQQAAQPATLLAAPTTLAAPHPMQGEPMTRPPNKRDLADFKAYLAALTDQQVKHVFLKEVKARRKVYADLARYELFNRNRLADIDIIDMMKGGEL